MSYQVLARKWRPKTFSEVVGQEHILTALENGLTENRLHHAYLFSGTRGVGKTSIARLFAKGLNCEKGITADPCGQCAHCKAIEAGNFIDLIEIDAASRTKVEDTRELLDNVQYKPVQGRFKVYLIDEVHMLSRHSFNALLKTLEEPPEYVKFLLATTDPQKLPVTILSRCLQFHLKALEPSQISHHLAKILTAEKIPFQDAALDKIAQAAQGSIRDSLSLTDQAIALSNGNVNLDIVRTMLGLLDDQQPIDILYALQQGDGEKLMNVAQAVADRGADWDELLREVGEKLHQIAMYQLLPAKNEESPLALLARYLSPEDVQLFYQIIVMGRKELAFAPNPRIGAEMTLLRALAFCPKRVEHSDHIGAKPISQAEKTADQKSNEIVSVSSESVALPSVEQVSVQPIPVVTMSALNTEADNSESSHGLRALEQMKKLRAQTANLQAEKKKLTSVTNEKIQTIPVVSSHSSTSSTNEPTQFKSQLNRLASSLSENSALSDDNKEDDSEENKSATDYRWEWSNPELDEQETGIRPSEIKQALEKQTPELLNKMAMIAKQRDPWSQLIGEMQLDDIKLAKQIALNSLLLRQDESYAQLGLRSSQAHLLRENTLNLLRERFADFFQQPDFRIDIELNDDKNHLTPRENLAEIYQELSQQASIDLQQDEQLKLLQTTFNAKLNLKSIRPI